MITARQVLDARRGTLLSELPDIDRFDVVRSAVAQAFQSKGLHGGSDVDGLARSTEAIFAQYGTIMDDEVALVLNEGTRGTFGPHTYLAADNIAAWALAYVNSAVRLDAVKNARAIQQAGILAAAAEAKTARERAEFARTAPTKEWNAFVAAGGQLEIRFDGYAAAVYDVLVRLGKVHPTPDTVRECREQAERMRGRAPRKVLGIPTALDAIGRNDGSVEMTAKRLLLERYFTALYRKGITPDFSAGTQGGEDLPQ